MSTMLIRAAKALGTAAVSAVTLVTAPIGTPAASADPCPDVEVVFARGTAEPAGVGGTGQAFVAALRAQAPDKSIAVYPVNYPASSQFSNTAEFTQTVVDGIRDAGSQVQAIAANCPDTRIVLGGFSQGALVSGFTASATVPPGVPAELAPAPMPPEVADHVAAVALFGMPSAALMRSYGAPPVVIGSAYADKTIELCSPGDTICDGDPRGLPSFQHVLYGVNGMVTQAATFAANRL